MVLSPVQTGRDYASRSRSRCLSQAKQLVTATLIYAADHGDYLPSGEWNGAIESYHRNPKLLRCPVDEKASYGYAMNAHLLGAKLPSDPELAMIFDTDIPGPDAVSAHVRPLADGRHAGKVMVGYADGHVKMLPDRQAATVRTRPR